MTRGYPKQLLEQADALIALDSRRPRQANLRRAVSASYYGMFHFLVDRSCRANLGASSGRAGIRGIIARGFEHGAMKDVSKSFAAGTLPAWMRAAAPHLTIPPDLRTIAEMFVRLHEQRHRADYDLSDPLSRREAVRLIAAARDAVSLWPAVARPTRPASTSPACFAGRRCGGGESPGPPTTS